MLHNMYGFIKTVVIVVQIGNMDVVSIEVKWTVQCLISSLCGVSKRSFLVGRDVAVLKSGWAVTLRPEPLLAEIIAVRVINWLVFITETECVYCAVRSTFYVLPTQCIYMFCVDLRTNSDYFTVQH